MSEENQSVSNDNESGYPARGLAWFVVALLTIAYIFSYIDRIILGFLIEPIKADFDLSDTQIGLLIGVAFAIFYATMGLPLGWLVDRKPRKWVVMIGITIWSLATAASGFAKNFFHLFMARMMVGAGEASLNPSAMSLISDLFPDKARAKAIAVYSLALAVGSGVANLLIGAILKYAESLDYAELGSYGIDKPWQVVFIMVGLPGLLIALAFLFIGEPKRQKNTVKVSEGDEATIKDSAKFLMTKWVAYVGLFAMVSVMTVIAYASSWLPPTFERTWGWDAATFGFYNGWGLIALAGFTLFWGWFIDHLTKKGVKGAAFKITHIGLFIVVITSAIFPLFPNVWVAFAFNQLGNVGFTMMTTGGVTALLAIAPGQIRGQTVALYYMFISMTGLFIGPNIVPFFTDTVFGDESMIRYSMTSMAVVYGVPVLLLSGIIAKAYRKELAAVSD